MWHYPIATKVPKCLLSFSVLAFSFDFIEGGDYNLNRSHQPLFVSDLQAVLLHCLFGNSTYSPVT